MPTDPSPPPPPPEPTPTTTTTTTPTAAPAPAPARDDGGTIGSAIGVGVHAMLSGPVGPSIVYNGGRFHIEGILAFSDINDASTMAIGGRAWFHIHESPSASLSIGGGVGFSNGEVDSMTPGVPPAEASFLLLEGGAQVRFFATRNVALSAALGLSIIGGDGDAIVIGGQLTGGLGITYFLF